MKRLALQYLTLPHYRKSLFEHLWKDNEIEFKVFCGKQSPYDYLENFETEPVNVTYVNNKFYKIRHHKFIWQIGVLNEIRKYKPDSLILLGYDPHILSNIPLFIYAVLKNINVFWWGHATFGKQGWIGKIIRKFFYQFSQGILAYDEKGAERLKLLGINPSKVHIIWNCLNEDKYPKLLSSSLHLPFEQTYNLIFTGRLTERKKLELLIRAVANIISFNHSELRLDIVGDGPVKSSLIALVKDLNLQEKIVFHGSLYDKQVDELIKKSDLMVIPAWAGLSTIHAMSFGVPVITDNSEHHPPEVSAIIPNFTGGFYQENSIHSLEETIIEYLPKKEFLSRNCISLVQKRYTPEAVKNNILRAIYPDLKI